MPQDLTPEEFQRLHGGPKKKIESDITARAKQNVKEQDDEPTEEELSQADFAKRYPQAFSEMQISQQKGTNLDKQIAAERINEPITRPGALNTFREYAPPLYGAAKQGASDLVKIGGGIANAARSHPFVNSLIPDPLSQVSTAGRFGRGEPLSMYSGKGHERFFGTTPGSSEAGGAEAFKLFESFLPGGAMTRGVRTAGRVLPGSEAPSRFMLETANALTQAKLHGEEPGPAATWAGAPSVLGRAVAQTTRSVAPNVAASIENRGRSFYGGVFNPRTLRERSIASQAIDPLIDSRRSYRAGRRGQFSLPEGVYTTRGQIARHSQANMDALEQQKASLINLRPQDQQFPMSFDRISADFDSVINNNLRVRNRATGRSEFRSDVAEDTANHINDLRRRMEVVSETDPTTGERTIPYEAMMGFKDEADHILAQAGGFAEKRGADLASQPGLRASRYAGTAAREETQRAAPDIWAVDQQMSDWANSLEGIESGEIKSFGRVKGTGKPIMGGGGQGMMERGGRYLQYSTAITAWETIKQSPLFRTAIGKGILINIARAIQRGDFDRAAAVIGRTAQRIKSERLPELREMTPEQEEQIRREGSATGKPAARLGTDEPFPEGGPAAPRFKYDRNTGQLIPVP